MREQRNRKFKFWETIEIACREEISTLVIGQRIRLIRYITKKNQIELAEKLGVTVGNISLIENGKVASLNVDKLVSIAGILGIDVEILFSRKEIINILDHWQNGT